MRCPRCWRPTPPVRFTPPDYAFLLGVYLGDGYICRQSRTWKLRVFLDARHPRIVHEVRETMQRCFVANAVVTVSKDRGRCCELVVHSAHVPCLFPQHGPGRKHQRRIVLEPWQERQVREAPWSFLRGCIWTDGCSFMNRTGAYEYLSYEFANLSGDIRGLFEATCDLVGVRYRSYARYTRIYQRSSVALLEQHVGLKGLGAR